LNYHTAWFALVMRGRLRAGETILVHGAAGGLGTATLQTARGLGAQTIAVVSSDEKERVARDAGAHEVLRSDGAWREQAVELTGGGVDLVADPVGGDRFVDSLRALRPTGRLLVLGFTGGAIPEVKVNRLLLRNIEVVGAGFGAWMAGHPEDRRTVGAEVHRLAEQGVVRPLVGPRFALEDGAEAMRLLERRGATGKIVLNVGS
jgi:NADPH2:quinone reductase